MGRGRSIAAVTARELLSEPFVLLTTVSAVVLAALAPELHIHQFGESARMARDAGFSALLLGGLAIAVFGTVKTFRREIESGTAASALALSVSRTQFFLAKTLGCFLAYAVFAATVTAVSMTVVRGAEIGGAIAAAKGSVAQIWGPSFAVAISVSFVPLAVAAALNRFARFRFTLSANLTALALALAGLAYRADLASAARYLPAALLIAAPALVVLAAAAAFAVRFKANAASSFAFLVAAALLPAFGNYCLSDVLAYGGRVDAVYFAAALAALAPGIAGFLLLGTRLFEKVGL